MSDAVKFGDLSGGTAVVTGAASGIGEGIAWGVAERGMTVVAVDVDDARLSSVVENIRSSGGSAERAVVDVADAAAMDALATRVFAVHGDVRLLVNNAGMETAGFTWEMDPERWSRLQAVNVNGVFHGIRSFVPRMLECRTRGHVVNIASLAALSCGLSQQSAYNASKHAVLALTECLHVELTELDAPVRAHVVCPGPVASRIFAPEHAPEGTAAEAFAQYGDYVESVGLTGREAGEIILRGVEADAFWIKTHPHMQREFVRIRTDMLLADREPVAFVPGEVPPS